jgi:3-oxoacyl-[acyl-carrier protein] reductase
MTDCIWALISVVLYLAMSKAALVGMVKGLARDLGPSGITINNVHPGPVDTDMNPATSDFAKTLLQVTALPRYASGDEIASLVAYLAGPEAACVTGANLVIDGGFTASGSELDHRR